jgi:SAM-dependent methyltransferase
MNASSGSIEANAGVIAHPSTSAAPVESSFGRAYRRIYSALCGVHPRLRPWHFQWLSAKFLSQTFRELLPPVRGRVLDAGCGDKPYRALFDGATEYVGLDVYAGPNVDIVVAPGEPWPLPDGHFDVLISSQVLEHVADLDFTVGEMKRVAKKGGWLVVSVPFIYNEHGSPNDFQRFTVYRAIQLFPEYEVVRLKKQGGLGSTVSILVLNWVDVSLGATKAGRMLKAPLLPLWMLFCLVMNTIGLAVNAIDRTDSFYSNLVMVLRKPES